MQRWRHWRAPHFARCPYTHSVDAVVSVGRREASCCACNPSCIWVCKQSCGYIYIHTLYTVEAVVVRCFPAAAAVAAGFLLNLAALPSRPYAHTSCILMNHRCANETGLNTFTCELSQAGKRLRIRACFVCLGSACSCSCCSRRWP